MSKIDISLCKPRRQGTYLEFISSENRCTHIGKNPRGHDIRQFKIDGEVLLSGTSFSRCDYLLLNDTTKTSYYIELKGSDILRAIKQIENTVSLISDSLPGYKVLYRIVFTSGSHHVKDSKVLKWEKSHSTICCIKRFKIEEFIS